MIFPADKSMVLHRVKWAYNTCTANKQKKQKSFDFPNTLGLGIVVPAGYRL